MEKDNDDYNEGCQWRSKITEKVCLGILFSSNNYEIQIYNLEYSTYLIL